MKRTTFPKFKVDGILTSDWHMLEKEKNPPCRTDSHYKAQNRKIKQISKLQVKYDCPVYNAGDLFDYWKGSPELINHCFKIFPKRMKGVAGQHDLPQHSLDLLHKCAFESLVRGGSFEFMLGQGHWGTDFKKIRYHEVKGRKIIILHFLVWKDELPFPDCLAPNVNVLFKTFPKADLILTGDNHKTFTAKKGKQILINPGSLTRLKADQIDHKPCVFLWDAKQNKTKVHYLKIENDVISREHIDLVNDKEERSEEFISSLEDDWLVDLSFENNIEQALLKNKIDKPVEKLVLEWIGK